jgi:hypothetical protein
MYLKKGAAANQPWAWNASQDAYPAGNIIYPTSSALNDGGALTQNGSQQWMAFGEFLGAPGTAGRWGVYLLASPAAL